MKTPVTLSAVAFVVLAAGIAWRSRGTEEVREPSRARTVVAAAPERRRAEPIPPDAPLGRAAQPIVAPRFTSNPDVARSDVARSDVAPPDVAPPRELELGERELMVELRKLLSSDPAKVIRLASAKNRELPNSPDAPERAWMIVKSLDGLGRFREAQSEARKMVESYPNDRFALDVERHELIYPLDQPSREEMQAGMTPRPEAGSDHGNR